MGFCVDRIKIVQVGDGLDATSTIKIINKMNDIIDAINALQGDSKSEDATPPPRKARKL